MSKMIEKSVGENAVVTIWRDKGHHGFYVGKVPDDRLSKHPMGAFQSLESAKDWADHQFPGGTWH